MFKFINLRFTYFILNKYPYIRSFLGCRRNFMLAPLTSFFVPFSEKYVLTRCFSAYGACALGIRFCVCEFLGHKEFLGRAMVNFGPCDVTRLP